jgi:NAD(P)-dependent dehydrogenase (short-subunit alcohol dehydrogenase family)
MSIALVTGSSTGIGLATVVTLARAGHTVYAAMRNPAKGAAEIESIAAKESLAIHVVALDVDSDASVKECFSHVEPVDVLVNNAGIGMSGSVEELPLAHFKRAMETNFFGAIRCIQAVVAGMRERRRGLIVNVTSVAGRIASAPQAAYAASKWALEALSEALAQEMKAFGVRVAIVEPGVIATPIFEKGNPEAARNSIYPQGRRARAMFQASLKNPVSPYVVGEAIRDIVESDSWQLRYPVGPDAKPILAWRASVSDEDWISGGAATDEQWKAGMKQFFGLDIEL